TRRSALPFRRVETFWGDPVLAEDASGWAEPGHRRFPGPALGRRELEQIRGRRRGRDRGQDCNDRRAPDDELNRCDWSHCCSRAPRKIAHFVLGGISYRRRRYWGERVVDWAFGSCNCIKTLPGTGAPMRGIWTLCRPRTVLK